MKEPTNTNRIMPEWDGWKGKGSVRFSDPPFSSEEWRRQYMNEPEPCSELEGLIDERKHLVRCLNVFWRSDIMPDM